MKRRFGYVWFVKLRPVLRRFLARILRVLPISSRNGGVPKGVILDAAEWVRMTEEARPWAERGCRHWQIKVRDSEAYIGNLPLTIEKSVHPAFFDQHFSGSRNCRSPVSGAGGSPPPKEPSSPPMTTFSTSSPTSGGIRSG